MKNAFKLLAKNVIIPLGLRAATDAAIHKKVYGSGRRRMLALYPLDLTTRKTTLRISNEEINFTKIVKSL